MNKIARFFEDHVEKVVLVVVGIISLFLLFIFVIRSPNKVEIGDEEFGPSAIDKEINQQAMDLKREIGKPDSAVEPYNPRLPEFTKLMKSALSDINVQVANRTALKTDDTTFATGVYRIPDIGKVSDVMINLIRAVAYLPVAEVTIENTYDDVENEPNDLDLVSVEAKFDVEQLYKNFRECFYDNVEQVFADPCLAKPIFAKVQLQRQKLSDNGIWSQWQEVPRPRIDHNRELFNIGEKVDELPTGGLKVLKTQFGYKQTQIDLLQPEPYQFASAREEWFPPSLHGEYAEFQRKERIEELRKQKEEEKKKRKLASATVRRERVEGPAPTNTAPAESPEDLDPAGQEVPTPMEAAEPTAARTRVAETAVRAGRRRDCRVRPAVREVEEVRAAPAGDRRRILRWTTCMVPVAVWKASMAGRALHREVHADQR